jgi:hypothetical protein
MSESEEEDYMNIQVDQQSLNQTITSYTKQRTKRLNEALEKAHKKTKYVEQQEELDLALHKKIGVENKGWQLLTKMGFKPGDSLGNKGDGIIEPIGIQLKSDKLGLGKRATQTQSFVSLKEKESLETSIKENQKDFRESMYSKYSSVLVVKDLRAARLACLDLDGKNGVKKHIFWPETTFKPTLHLDPGVKEYSNTIVEETDEFTSEKEQFENQSVLSNYF